MPDLICLGEFLKQIRFKKCLSMTDVFNRTGITTSRLSKLERGLVAEPSAELLCELSKLYQINILDIFRAAGYQTSTVEQNLLERVEMLNTEEIENLQKTIDLLIQGRKF